MRTNILRSAALALGLFAYSTALGQYGGYPAGGAQGYGYGPAPTAGSVMPVHPSLQTTAAGNLRGAPAGPQQTAIGYGPQGGPAPQPAPGPGYPMPAGWGSSPYRAASTGEASVLQPNAGDLEALPVPQGQHGVEYYPSASAIGSGYAGAHAGHSMLPSAQGAPLAPKPSRLRNWFAGGGLLLMDIEEDCDRRLLFDVNSPERTILSTDDVGFGGETGYEVFLGRYVGFGQHAIVANYWGIDGGPQSVTAAVPGGGDYRAAMPMWDRAFVDIDGDGSFTAGEDVATLYDDATAYRLCREARFRNFEVNFISFGLGGAARAVCGGTGCGVPCGSCGPQGGSCVGGACGEIVPACQSKLRLQISHGLRWFQFEDMLQFAASRAVAGYGSTHDDLYYIVNVENNLLGYQFGSRADYCVGKRLNLYAGGKVGLYANDVDFNSRLSSGAALAQVGSYYPSYAGQTVEAEKSNTELAFIGELDMGIGIRATRCVSFRGGYRIIAANGVATAPGQISADPAHLAEAAAICADKSVILHGAYLGAEYNW